MFTFSLRRHCMSKRGLSASEETRIVSNTGNLSCDTMLLTNTFAGLLKILDTSGYAFEPDRIGKTYSYRSFDRPTNACGYTLFQYDTKSSALTIYFHEFDGDTSRHGEYYLDIRLLEKNQRILSYYFTRKIPEMTGDSKWFTDGVVEEWEFPDIASAANAAMCLAFNPGYYYLNVSAFICYKKNYMYIFTSRASGFMYSIRPIFKQFVNNNKMTETTKW